MKVMATILLCVTVMHCLAQEVNKFSLGVKAGGGWAGWRTDYNGTVQTLPSEYIVGDRFIPAYTFGLSGKYALVSHFGVNIGLLYLRGGSKYVNNYEARYPDGTSFISRNEITLRLSSLRTPIYLSWDFGKGNIQPFVKIGASFNWILGGHRSYYDSNPSASQPNEIKNELFLDIADNEKLLQDWSFFGGIGMGFHQRLLLEADMWLGPARYYAFADPAAFPPCFNCLTVNYWDRTYHNRAILLTLTYLLIN